MSKLANANNRRESGDFVAFPLVVLRSENFRYLSGNAMKVLCVLLGQLRWKKDKLTNNGNLAATFTQAQAFGFKSKTTLSNGLKELLEKGMIEVTRDYYFSANTKNEPKLYGVTWLRIDEIKPNRAPSGLWRRKVKEEDEK